MVRSFRNCDLTALRPLTQYGRVIGFKRNLRGLLAVLIAATLMLAYVPSAHAHGDHSANTFEAEAVQAHSDAHSGHGGFVLDLDQALSGAAQIPCCDETGVCAVGFSFSMDGSALELTLARDGKWPAGVFAFTAYDPALDLPPPRRS